METLLPDSPASSTSSTNTRTFIAASICAHGKSLHQHPAGLLQSLSTPWCPWSHIALDFVTGLPLSERNAIIMTVVDRFPRSAHFVPLLKLPSAEMGYLLAQHVFCFHRLPKDIISDRGLQFTFRVWCSFCVALKAIMSLSSFYYPQSNGQTERMNQILENTLQCMAVWHPAA